MMDERKGSVALTIAAALLAGVLLPSVAMGDGVARPESTPPPSIHARELTAWNVVERAGRDAWTDPAGPAPAPRVARAPTLTSEVHGYHPYWMGSAYLSYPWSLLSTLAWFALELDGAGNLVDRHGWPWTTLVSTAHANGVRVVVTATLFDSAALDLMLADPARRANAVANLVGEVVAAGADGVNVDFEGVPHARKADLVAFLGELQAALAGAVPSPYLTIATPAVDWNDAYDYDELAARCDHLMVMAYDYHWSGSPATGPVAPLGGWGTYDVPWTVADYFLWGALPSDVLLGVPYYGYEWGAVSASPGAATTASGVALTYAQAKDTAELHGALWDVPSSTPWYRYQDPGWFQGWFEDAPSLAAKYALVESENLAGVGVWALGYDGVRPELWAELAAAFGVGTVAPVVEQGPAVRLAHGGAHPFRDRAVIRWEIPRRSDVRLSVTDVTGRAVRSLLDGPAAPSGSVTWDGRNAAGRAVPAGVYFVRLEAGELTQTLRAVRLR